MPGLSSSFISDLGDHATAQLAVAAAQADHSPAEYIDVVGAAQAATSLGQDLAEGIARQLPTTYGGA